MNYGSASLEIEDFHEPTYPRPLQGGEQNSGRATAVPLLGGVRGGFMVPMRDSEIVDATHEPDRGVVARTFLSTFLSAGSRDILVP